MTKRDEERQKDPKRCFQMIPPKREETKNGDEILVTQLVGLRKVNFFGKFFPYISSHPTVFIIIHFFFCNYRQ